MNRIIRTLRLDALVVFRFSLMILGVAYVIGSVLGLLVHGRLYTTPILILLFSSISSGMFFSLYEKNNLSKLYGTLPLRRSDIVKGRYLYGLLLGLGNLAIAALLTVLIGKIINNPLSGPDLSMALAASFLFFCFIVALQNPIYIRFGFSKAYIATNLPFYLLFVGTLLLVQRGGAVQFIANTYQYFNTNPWMSWVVGIGGGLLLYGISLVVSEFLFRKTEI